MESDLKPDTQREPLISHKQVDGSLFYIAPDTELSDSRKIKDKPYVRFFTQSYTQPQNRKGAAEAPPDF